MKIAIYDASESRPLGWSWAVGSRLLSLTHFDAVIGARTWEEALGRATTAGQKRRVSEIQFWGHGSPGRILIKDQVLDPRSGHKKLLHGLRDVLEDEALIWFRVCAAFAADRGQKLATSLASELGRRVASSTHNIGFPWHSGQRSLAPGQAPEWDAREGLDEDGEPVWSRRRAPNTIMFLDMKIPRGW
jgi:hypothetical protein